MQSQSITMASTRKPFSTDWKHCLPFLVTKVQARFRGNRIRRLLLEERAALTNLKPIPGITTKVKAWIRSWDARQAVLDTEKLFEKFIKAETKNLSAEETAVITRHMQALLRGAYTKHTFQQYMCALGSSMKVNSIVKEHRKQVAADRKELSELASELAELKCQREALEKEIQEERGKVAALEIGSSIKARRLKSESNPNLLRLVGGR